MWEAVAQKVGAPRSKRRFGGPRVRTYAPRLAAALLLVVVCAVVVLRPSRGGVIAGLVVETRESEQPITLPDGSLLAVAPNTRLSVLTASTEDVRLRVERGTLTCDVVPGRPRRFVVEAEGTEVEVKGTRFVVEVTDAGSAGKRAVAVRVDHGVVEVRDASHKPVASLEAGQAWMSHAPPPAAEETVEPAIPRAADAPPSPPPPSTGSHRRSFPSAPPSARELFEQADAAQLAGRSAEAAASFDQLRRRFPNDARAGVAAFQLGRLRLRKLGDPKGAAEAFAFTLAHEGTGAFREDAEAGLVESLARAGDHAGCRKARGEFLARYASSPLAAHVAAQCSE
jgi:TolA-binding protein